MASLFFFFFNWMQLSEMREFCELVARNTGTAQGAVITGKGRHGRQGFNGGERGVEACFLTGIWLFGKNGVISRSFFEK